MKEDSGGLAANWAWTSVGEVGEVSGGVTKNSSKTGLANKLPYLRVANVYANELRLDSIAEIAVTPAERTRALLVRATSWSLRATEAWTR
jgi:type I restriction enzyme S subunit